MPGVQVHGVTLQQIGIPLLGDVGAGAGQARPSEGAWPPYTHSGRVRYWVPLEGSPQDSRGGSQ